METASLDPSLTSITPFAPADLLARAATELSPIRFLEFGLRAHHELIVFANAYRAGDRTSLSRDRLDSSLHELELRTDSRRKSERATSRDSTDQLFCQLRKRDSYRAGDVRFASGSPGDAMVWDLITGLVFNLVSIDARAGTDSGLPLFLLEAGLKHGLLDSDGFILLFHGTGAESTLTPFAAKVASRFPLRSEPVVMNATGGMVRFLPS